jgi:hypothetical protein
VRCWRLPDGSVLVEVERHPMAPFHRLAASRLVCSYWTRRADDSELLYTFGYCVVDDRFEHATTIEVGYPYREETTSGDTILEGLVELPDGTVTDNELSAALRLADLVKAAYTALADCPVPKHVEGCPCCRPFDADRALLDTPRWLLEPDGLAEYLTSALTTWGDDEHFKYFAPRILELVVTERVEYPDVEIVLGKFRAAGWTSWAPAHRHAVGELLDHYWTTALATHPGPRPVADVLCALGQALDDLRPLLDRWALLGDRAAALHLRDFAAIANEVRVTGRLPNAFWNERPAQRRQVVCWLLSAQLETAVEAAFFRAGDTGDAALAETLSQTHQYLAVPR